ncbi:MAG: hypothetical protein JXR88_03625 [Clostridia bacterium]|nr:hypothetical protein [Clostridia bacterium]
MKVLVVTGLEDLERDLQKSEKYEIYVSASKRYQYLQEGLQHIETVIEREKFDAVVLNRYLDHSDNGEEIVNLLRNIKRGKSDFRLILILSDYDKQIVYPLVKAGIYDLLIDEGISKNSILSALDNPAADFDFKKYEVNEAVESRINFQMPTFSAKEKWKSKKVITVYSPCSKGASEISVAITKALSNKSDKVCLVDFDYLRPTIREKLSIKSNQGLYDAVQLARQDNLSAQNVLGVLSDKDNFKVLTGMYELNEQYHLNEEYLTRIIDVLQSNFEFLVIDVHSYYDLITNFVAFEKSDVIYTVTTGDKQTLERTMLYVEMFNKYDDVKPDTLKVVVNNYGGYDLTSVEIEDIVKSEVYYVPQISKSFFKTNAKRSYDRSIDELIRVL